MSSNSLPVRTDQSLRVATFLDGLTLTALTFIVGLEINYPPITFITISYHPPFTFLLITISYKELLILVSGTAAAFLISSVFGLKAVLVRGQSEREFFASFALYSYEAGYLAILIFLPLLVLPFSMLGTVAIAIVEALWFTIWIADHIRGERITRRINKNISEWE
jgi:hypothetical protein